jgi:Arc/MetJ-type ribon-helix-helix transcriptional regulator
MKVIYVMKLISVNLPEAYINVLEILVTEGKFPNRSEAIRVAIRDLIKTEYLIEKSVKDNLNLSTIESQLETEIQEKLLI